MTNHTRRNVLRGAAAIAAAGGLAGTGAAAPPAVAAPQRLALPDRAFGNAHSKHDLLRGTAQVHRLPRGAAASEAVFVPSDPTGPRAAEDDGYAIAYVHDPDRGASDLVILAAQDFGGEPVARIHLPGRVPLGFHGSWVPDA